MRKEGKVTEEEVVKKILIPTAKGKYLSRWAQYVCLRRENGEHDETLRERIIESFRNPLRNMEHKQ